MSRGQWPRIPGHGIGIEIEIEFDSDSDTDTDPDFDFEGTQPNHRSFSNFASNSSPKAR